MHLAVTDSGPGTIHTSSRIGSQQREQRVKRGKPRPRFLHVFNAGDSNPHLSQRTSQYSSGSNRQLLDLSASVRTHTRHSTPLGFTSYTDMMRQPFLTLRSFSLASAGHTSPQSPLAWRATSVSGGMPCWSRTSRAEGVPTILPSSNLLMPRSPDRVRPRTCGR